VAGQRNGACWPAILSAQAVVYFARIPGRHILSVSLDVGTRLPAYCTSMGRILLAGLTSGELDAFLGQATIERRTPKTIIDIRQLADAIGKAKADGFAIVDEELELGLRSIAVPIRDRAERTVAAINVSTQSARFSVAEMEREILPALLAAKQSIEDFFVV